MDEPYLTFKKFLSQKFPGLLIRKIPIDAGMSCPNKNGSVSTDGCIFCDRFGAGPVRSHGLTIQSQIENFMGLNPGIKYIAYYQANSNTHEAADVLKQKYNIIFQYPDIIGLFIGTRPDAIGHDVYPLLKQLNQQTYLNIELGLQSIHEKSLLWLRRNHTYGQFLDTYSKLSEMGIEVIIHLIVGIPGESREDMAATIKEMNRLQPRGVKIHLMHVLKDTPLARLYKKNEFSLMTMDEYIETVIHLLEHLSPDIVIHRLTGERDKELFIAPDWAKEKHRTIDTIKKRMNARGSRQGLKVPPRIHRR